MTFDPYVELGVSRDADKAQVRRAYRSKAKRTHPDTKGGDADAFQRARRAMVVLTDPAKRAKFDTTGSADDDKPDNTRSAAIQIIEKFMGEIVQGYITGGFQPQHDSRRHDVVKVIKKKIEAEIVATHQAIKTGEKVISFLTDMAKRLSGDEPGDPVGALYAHRIQHAESTMITLRENIVCRELALKVLARYRFRADKSAADAYNPYLWSGTS